MFSTLASWARSPAGWARWTHDNLDRFGKFGGALPSTLHGYRSVSFTPVLAFRRVCCSFLIRFSPSLHSCCAEGVYLGLI